MIDGLVAAGYSLAGEIDPSTRPALLDLQRETATLRLRVFCWNITSGGHGRPPQERRVQTTRPGQVPLSLEGVQSLVLGYDEERDIFVAWDATTHPNPSASASLQVPIETIEEAASTGFAGRERSLADGTPEVVVAFRPELVATYLNLIPAFHVTREDEGEATASAARGVERPLEELPGNVEQRRTIRKVARLVRDARFRDAVLRAYDRRCAFCGLGLGLVQAAHLRPVREEGADQVRNGVAACPTHHAAFDAGLVVIDDDFAIRVNSARLEARGTTEEDVARLAESLLDQLRLPEAEALRPAPENLLVHRKRWLEQ